MKKLRLLFLPILLLSQIAFSQPGKNLVPTATKSLVIFQLKDFGKGPLAKATLVVQSIDKAVLQSGKTDKNGIWECLLPINQTYWISVGDSLNYNQLTVPNKPSTITKHTIYYNGWLNGKPTVVGAPQFNMMPPAEGLASIDMEFIGLQEQPLVHELVTLTADGSKKTFVDSTDANGKLIMKVPIGENYTMSVTYNAKFDHFEFPAHGGSYNARVRYKYAGKQAIDDMRAARLARQQEYDAYVLLNREEQLKKRDANGHKTDFNVTPVKTATHPFKLLETKHGYSLSLPNESPMMTPCYMDGLLFAGAGWDDNTLAAVDAETGQPVWTVSLSESGISNIEGDDDVVVCATESCTIYAIAAKTGKLLWSKWLATYVLSAPCIADGKVYIGYEDKVGSEAFGGIATDKPYAMACFDLQTGAIVWQQWIRGEVMSSPVAEDKRLFFNTFSGHTYVLNRENGNVIAEKQLFGTSAPTIVNGLVCMGQRDAGTPTAMERIAMFDPANNLVLKVASPYQLAPYLDAKAFRKTLLASNDDNLSLNTGSSGTPIANAGKVGPAELVGRESIFAIQSFEGSRVLHANDRLYVTQGNILRCLDAKTLNLVWENDFHIVPSGDGGGTMSPPIGAGGKIIVACTDGILRMVLPGNGIEYMGYETGERQRQQPIAAKGSIFVPCTNGKLTVVKTVFPEVDGWFCWGGNASRKNKAANR